MLSTSNTGSDSSKVPGAQTTTYQKLDGKTQPIDQYRLSSKKAGKNTKEIQQEWLDSITTAHTMLVGVNQELSNILEKLDAISAKLDKIKDKSKLAGAIDKVNYVRDRMFTASGVADDVKKDFENLIPKHIDHAAQQISLITDEDFNKLKNEIGEDEVNELQTIFHQINLLAQNINANRKDANPQDANQAAETSKKKKSPSLSFLRNVFSNGGEDESANEEKSSKKKKVSFEVTDPAEKGGDIQKKPITESEYIARVENELSTSEKGSSKKKFSTENKESPEKNKSPEKKESTKKNAKAEAEASSDSVSDSLSDNSDSAAEELKYVDLPKPALIPNREEIKPQ